MKIVTYLVLKNGDQLGESKRDRYLKIKMALFKIIERQLEADSAKSETHLNNKQLQLHFLLIRQLFFITILKKLNLLLGLTERESRISIRTLKICQDILFRQKTCCFFLHKCRVFLLIINNEKDRISVSTYYLVQLDMCISFLCFGNEYVYLLNKQISITRKKKTREYLLSVMQ